MLSKLTNTVVSVSARLIIYAIILLVLVRGAVISYKFGHGIFYASAVAEAPGTDIDISIPEGCDAGKAAAMLKEKGLINNELSFIVQAKFFELDITPGNYTLNNSQTSRDILEKLNDGPGAEEEKN